MDYWLEGLKFWMERSSSKRCCFLCFKLFKPDEHIHLKDSSVTKVGIQDSDSLNWSEILFGHDNVFAAPESHVSMANFGKDVADKENHCGHGFYDIGNTLHNHVMSVSGESKEDGDAGVRQMLVV